MLEKFPEGIYSKLVGSQQDNEEEEDAESKAGSTVDLTHVSAKMVDEEEGPDEKEVDPYKGLSEEDKK